jgi:hypothetical protein
MVPLSADVQTSVELAALLPGPSRKRVHRPYVYRLTYRSADLDQAGCLMTWEVRGGRLVYQIAIERDERGRLRCHCTCADWVFRAEAEGRVCKHVQGFLTCDPQPAGEMGRAG